ncbi:hypothetical protein WME73_38245 [Sorangium sp. So ce302]|uniref:hypothetical protein n=1 Tax=Sorangium sp. So ce302 TaxID=3133297 RepID=UPI003F5D7BFD
MTNHDHDLSQPVDEPRRPTCLLCLERADAPAPPEGKHRPSGLFAPGDVRQATDGKEPDGARHAAHKAGLRHWYKLTTFIECSFPDKTPHKNGYIVETLCGRVVNIGKDCGRSNVIGLDQIIAYAGEQEQRAADIVEARGRPEELAARAEPIAAEVARVLAFTDRLADKLPAIVFEMQRRADSGDRRVQVTRVVEREREDGTKFMETVVDELTLLGLDAWAEQPPGDLLAAGRRLRDEIAAELAEDPDPEPEKARRLARRIDRFRKDLDRAEDWLSRVRLFFGDQNLALAVYAANLTNSVKVDEGRLVFFDKEKKTTYALGVAGLFVVKGRQP